MTIHSTLIRGAAISGFVGVAAGAFGAHGLKNHVDPALLPLWHTAGVKQCEMAGRHYANRRRMFSGWMVMPGIGCGPQGRAIATSPAPEEKAPGTLETSTYENSVNASGGARRLCN